MLLPDQPATGMSQGSAGVYCEAQAPASYSYTAPGTVRDVPGLLPEYTYLLNDVWAVFAGEIIKIVFPEFKFNFLIV